jgi:glucokinase
VNRKFINILGIDLGGTNARAGIVEDGMPKNVNSISIHSEGSANEVMNELLNLIDQTMDSSVEAIGIGVPSVVDIEEGVVYDIQNIPSWKEVHMKEVLEEQYHRPVLVNNDANCFALGEKYFGKGRNIHSMVGLIIGTGIAGGIIINDQLYTGANCGAGEFGMVDYQDQYYEYYVSGQYFENVYHTKGEEVFRKAQKGDQTALSIFEEFGVHLANAIKMILYTFDPEQIILGGSVSRAYPYFKSSMRERIHTLAYHKSLEKFRVEVSELNNGGILGAAALYYNYQGNGDCAG